MIAPNARSGFHCRRGVLGCRRIKEHPMKTKAKSSQKSRANRRKAKRGAKFRRVRGRLQPDRP